MMEKTPYELLNGRKPNIAYFQVFGCKCYILKKGTRLSKFEKKCDEGFLLAYSTTSKAYRVWNLASGILEEVHDVEFDETNGFQEEDENLDDVRGTQLVNAMKNMDIGELRPREVIDIEDDKNQVLSNSNVQASGSHDQIQASTSDANVQDQQMASSSSQPSDQSNASNQVQVLQPTNVPRDHLLVTIIGDISRGVQTRSRLASFCEHFLFVSSIEPKKIDEALKDVDWINAMHEELNNFTRNQVWDLVERPKHHNVIRTRLVAQGYTQVEGLDFGETYAPVARLEAIRILLGYACANNIKLYQMDVKSVFLNGYINELVYVEQPPGFEDEKKPNHVYKLRKALYGLKQAPRAWYERLRDFLLSKGFKMGKIDTTLFTKKLGNDWFVMQIYVDDIIFGSTNQEFCEEFGKMMASEFEMSMIRELSYFLGLQIKQMKNGIFVSQGKYIKDMLKKFEMDESKAISTPMGTSGSLDSDASGNMVDQKMYRSMIGSLLYVTASRPDVMFSVCMCARFQASPRESHLKAIQRILRYLKHTQNVGLWYPKGARFELIGYSDSDYA
jgi:hypothetical protein